MAKKPYEHTQLSDVTCSEKGCSKRIKKNLIHRKPTKQSFKCYPHYMNDLWAKRNKK